MQQWSVNLQQSRQEYMQKKKIRTQMLTAVFFTVAKTWEQHKCPPTAERSYSMNNGILPHHKKE